MGAHRMPRKARHFASRLTSSPGEPIPRSSALGRGREEGRPSSPPPPARLLKRKENSSRGPHRRLEVRSRCRMMVWEEDGGAAGGRVEGTDPFLRPTPADPLPQDDIPAYRTYRSTSQNLPTQIVKGSESSCLSSAPKTYQTFQLWPNSCVAMSWNCSAVIAPARLCRASRMGATSRLTFGASSLSTFIWFEAP
jgi:hypothetical protein